MTDLTSSSRRRSLQTGAATLGGLAAPALIAAEWSLDERFASATRIVGPYALSLVTSLRARTSSACRRAATCSSTSFL